MNTFGSKATLNVGGKAYEIFRLKVREEDRQPGSSRRTKSGEGRTIFVSILARMFVVPLIFLPLMAIGALRDHPPVFQE